MKILFLTPWFPSHRQDQVGNFILDSAEALAALNHEIVVLVSRSWKPWGANLISKFWKNKKIHIEYLSDHIQIKTCEYLSIPRHYFESFSTWSYRKHVGKIVENLVCQYQCQLIHAHTELAGLVAVEIGEKIGIPSVVTLHGISTEKKLYSSSVRKLLFEYTLEKANCIILVGEYLGSFFKNFVKHYEHFRVVHNGFRLYPYVVNNNFLKHDCLRFISVSHLHEGKGIDLNLRALARLKASGYVQWVYKIIGDGYEKKNLQRLVTELGLETQVDFLGYCKHNEVYSHLIQSDVFILPSYREAFGISYVEAMSCGLLTVAVIDQGPSAFIEHNKTGLLVKAQDVDSLFKTLESIIQSPKKFYSIAIAGKEYVHRYLTWYNHAKKLVHTYEELIKDSCAYKKNLYS